MRHVMKSEPGFEQGSLKPWSAIDQEFSGLDVMFLAEFRHEAFGKRDRSRGEELGVQEFVRFEIDSGVQPVALIVESNHDLVERDVIRILATGCKSAFCTRLWTTVFA